MRLARRRRETTGSSPLRWHLASALDGSISTLTPMNLPEKSLFSLSRRSRAGSSIFKAFPPRAWSSRSRRSSEVVHESGRPIENRLFEGPTYVWARVNDTPAWPKPATTDGDGRFTLHGVGRRHKAALSIIDPRFALQNIDVETDDSPGAKIVTTALLPAKIFTGRVTDAGTGKPIPHAKLLFLRIRRPRGSAIVSADAAFRPMPKGDFARTPSPGERFDIAVTPPSGQFYLETRKRVDWPKGGVEQSARSGTRPAQRSAAWSSKKALPVRSRARRWLSSRSQTRT